MANILIADDEKEIVRLLRMYIEANDNIVYEANDGQEALQILHKENIDLALLYLNIIQESSTIITEMRHVLRNEAKMNE
jgi:CheY-like chemotaxis protein